MYITRVKADKHYPYRIVDGWGGEVLLTPTGLKVLKEEIEKIFQETIDNESEA